MPTASLDLIVNLAPLAEVWNATSTRSHAGAFLMANTSCPLLFASLAKVSARSAHLRSRRCQDTFCSFSLTAFLCLLPVSAPTPSLAVVWLPGPTAPSLTHKPTCHCLNYSGGSHAGGEKPSMGTGWTSGSGEPEGEKNCTFPARFS